MKPSAQHLEALKRLWQIANGHSGQCRTVAMFLLGLYNGQRFKFDMTNFRVLDGEIFHDCLVVLAMDWAPEKEVHEHLGVPCSRFEQLAKDWKIKAGA